MSPVLRPACAGQCLLAVSGGQWGPLGRGTQAGPLGSSLQHDWAARQPSCFPRGRGAPKFGWPNGLRRGRVADYPLVSGEFVRAS